MNPILKALLKFCTTKNLFKNVLIDFIMLHIVMADVFANIAENFS